MFCGFEGHKRSYHDIMHTKPFLDAIVKHQDQALVSELLKSLLESVL